MKDQVHTSQLSPLPQPVTRTGDVANISEATLTHPSTVRPCSTGVQVQMGEGVCQGLPSYESLSTPNEAQVYWRELVSIVAKPEFYERVLGCLENLVSKVRARHEKDLAHRAVGWLTTDGTLCVGVERPHPNPPQWISAETAASAIVMSSGRFNSVVAAFVWDECARRSQLMPDVAMGALRHYLTEKIGDAVLIGRNVHSAQVVVTELTKVRPFVGWSDITSTELRQLSPISQPILWELPQSLDYTNPQPELLELIRDKILHPVFLNSTCDGISRPARKAHAAAAVSGRYVVAAPNARDPEWPGQVRCAEKNLVGLAETVSLSEGLEIGKWESTLIYSAHYISNGTNGTPRGHYVRPASCPPCLGDLSEHIVDDFGDMNLINMSPSSWEQRKISEFGIHHYGERDRESIPESS